MENSPIYAFTLVVALVAALAFNPAQADAPTIAQTDREEAHVLAKPAANGTPNFVSGTPTGAVVFSDEEGRLIEIALGQVSTTTTDTTDATDTTDTTTSGTSGTSPTTTGTTAPTSTTSPPPTPPSSTTTSTTSGTGFRSDYESSFYSLINSYRSDNGLNRLTRNGSLDAFARDWAEYLGSIGKLTHDRKNSGLPPLSSLLPPWTRAGETLSAGYSVSGLFNALVNNTCPDDPNRVCHREIILGDFTHIGVGVWVDADGAMWAVQVFAHD